MRQYLLAYKAMTKEAQRGSKEYYVQPFGFTLAVGAGVLVLLYVVSALFLQFSM